MQVEGDVSLAASIPPIGEQYVGGSSTIEAQQMVRRVKTYTMIDSEFKSLAATTIAANLLLVVATFFISVGVDCMISRMAISPNITTTASQEAFFYWMTRVSFLVGAVCFALTIGAWIFGWSIFRHVRNTSREGKIITG